MAKCPKCNHLIPDTGGICPFCGMRLKKQESNTQRNILKPVRKQERVEEKSTEPVRAEEDRRVEEPAARPVPEEPVEHKEKVEPVIPHSKPHPEPPIMEEDRIEEESMDKSLIEEPDYSFDTNADGYYDDVLPIMAEEINKLPRENILRIVLTIVFIILIVLICLLK